MAAVKERPILFSGPLVRAILDGRKNVTRRLVKPWPERIGGGSDADNDPEAWGWATEDGAFVHLGGAFKPYQGPQYSTTSCSYLANCSHGQPGDRLWVRETHALYYLNHWPDLDHREGPDGLFAYYREGFDRSPPTRWRPSIHMPRWASRIDLEVLSVWAERLRDIDEVDAEREGVQVGDHGHETHRHLFAGLWDSINGRRPDASWADNPWVWRIEFRRVRP